MKRSFQIECAGYFVMADWYQGSTNKTILLSLIGWNSDRKRYGDILSSIVAATGVSSLVFDYSGHGESSFKASETRPAQHFLEVIDVFDWIKENYPNSRVMVMGTSYGGYLATQLTKYRAFDKLVLRAPAMYKPEDFYTKRKQVDGKWAENIGFRKDRAALEKHPLLARASSFKGKTLVVVHEHDEEVPRETTDAYIRAFNANVYIAKGLRHSIGDMPREQIVDYQKSISQWIAS